MNRDLEQYNTSGLFRMNSLRCMVSRQDTLHSTQHRATNSHIAELSPQHNGPANSPSAARSLQLPSRPQSEGSSSLSNSAENGCTDNKQDSLHLIIAKKYEMLHEDSSGYTAVELSTGAKVFIQVSSLAHALPATEWSLFSRIQKDSHVALPKDSVGMGAQCFLVFERYSHSLADSLGAPLAVATIKDYAQQMLKGVESCHRIGLIHYNITPKNIRYSSVSELKLVNLKSFRVDNKLNVNQYKAPELLLDAVYNSSVDLWSFGCILAEMVLGYSLFAGRTDVELFTSMVRTLGNPPLVLANLSSKRDQFFNNSVPIVPGPILSQLSSIKELKRVPQALELLELCLDWKPSNRLSALEALRHPFFAAPTAKFFRKFKTLT